MSSSKDAILTATEKPKTLAVNQDGIPAELRELRQWVCWRWCWKERDKRWTKTPINAKTGCNAKTTDPKNIEHARRTDRTRRSQRPWRRCTSGQTIPSGAWCSQLTRKHGRILLVAAAQEVTK